MKKLFTLVMALVAVMAINATVVTFNFTDPSSLGITAPEAGRGTNITEPVVVEGVTMTGTSVSTPNRIFNSSGNYDLRIYKNNTLTISANENITAIEFAGSSINFAELTGQTWIATEDVTEVTFTASVTTKVNYIIVTVGEEPVVWQPDTISVTEAYALIAANDWHDHYVMGVLMNAPFNVYSDFSGTVSFWMSDIVNPNDSIEFYQGTGEGGAKWASLLEAQEILHKGDTVMVYAAQLKLYTNSEVTIHEITGGYYAEMIGQNPDPEEVVYPKLSVAEAVAIAQALTPWRGQSQSTIEIYSVEGYVTSVQNAEDKSYYLADEVGAYSVFQAYKCASTDFGANVGDFVKVIGLITHYYGNSETSGDYHTYEISGGYLIHLDPLYSITSYASPETAGSVSRQRSTLTAIPNEGYHFVSWQDGNTDNPRTIEVTQDTTFTAVFAINIYSITLTCDATKGSVEGPQGDFEHGTELTYTATPNYGYHFAQWSDRDNSNPRSYVVTKDATIEAIFVPNQYSLSALTNPNGSVSGTGSFDYLTECTFEAIPNYGYHFVQWNDGNKANPRTLVLTQDTTFSAEYAIDKSGKCGDNLALLWEYDAQTKTLTISGEDQLNSNYTFGIEAPNAAEKLVIAEGVSAIGNSAFAGYSALKHITLSSSVEMIYEYAFYNCSGLVEIYSYRSIPADAYSNTFDGIAKSRCTLYVLSSAVELYGKATGWRDFYNVQTIDAQEVTETILDVEVTPADNEVVVTWPTSDDAVTYSLQITKDGVVFCTLIFNANGQLLGISFAPARGGNNAPMAIHTANGGLRFTVTGLESGTGYQLTVTAKDANEEIVETYSTNFTTTGSANSPTGFEAISANDKCSKILHNGQILILRGEKVYTVTGQEVK